jgi:hypothetical protein
VYTLHCTYGQLFVLHCAADYHSGKHDPPELKINKNSKAEISAS